MSGHSKWATIKRDKESNDSKKGAVFTKFSKDISSCAKAGGGDIALNANLATTVAKAKAANMPNDKIQKAIDKGTGLSKSGLIIHSLSYEAYGPGEIGIIIDVSTDNKNRTLSEIKLIIERNGGRFVEGGAVSWLFESKGYVRLEFGNTEEQDINASSKWNKDNSPKKINKSNWEELELNIMDIQGVLDIEEDDDGVSIYVEPDGLGKVRNFFEEKNLLIDDSEIMKLAKTPVEVTDEIRARNLEISSKLKDNDDVEYVWLALS